MKVKALKQTSVVTEKEQYYVQIETSNGERLTISVGQKTYDGVNKLIESEKTKPQTK